MIEAAIAGPYPGARPFQQADRGRFFGRAADAAALAQLWWDNHLTIASGPVAGGKTSLLHAGVYPLISNEQANILPVGQLSFDLAFPAAALPAHNPYTLSLLRSWSPGETAASLAGLTVSDFLRTRVAQHHGPVLAAIDQVEELPAHFGPRWAQAQRFMLELADAVRLKEPRLHLLLVIREDSVRILTEGGIAGGPRHHVEPLTPAAAIEAVTGPTAGTGRVFAEGAAEMLVTDLQTSRIERADGGERFHAADHVEPALLQAVCTRLWRTLPPSVDLITADDVRSYGDADIALAEHCGHVIAAVAVEHDKSPHWLRNWLLDTFVSDEGTRRKERERQGATAKVSNALLRSLADRHLLAVSLDDGERSYRLLSDRLIEPLRKASHERPSPIAPTGYLRAAELALALGELELARQRAGRAWSTAPESDFRLRAKISSLLGNLADEQDKPREAAERYREAAKLYEAVRDSVAVARQLAAVGEMLAVQERYAEAVKELRAAANRLPNDPVVQTELALALWKLGEGSTAVAVLTALLGVDGGNLEALRTRGEILADLGRGREAMLDLDRVMHNGDPATRAARGLALAERGDRSAARQEINRVVGNDTWNGLELYYAARAAALVGDDHTARQLARRAVNAKDPALSPRHRDLADQLAGNQNGLSD